jgi:hypothetical protein
MLEFNKINKKSHELFFLIKTFFLETLFFQIKNLNKNKIIEAQSSFLTR